MEFVHYSYGYILKKTQKPFKCNNYANAKIVYAENSEQFLWENSEQFYLIQKTNFMNAIKIFKYIVNMMCRKQILLM